MLNRKYLSKSGFSKKKKITFKHLKNPTNQLNGTGQNFTILKTHMSVNQRILDVEKNPLSIFLKVTGNTTIFSAC